MTSLARVLANRVNAKKSTGPRHQEEAKAVVDERGSSTG